MAGKKMQTEEETAAAEEPILEEGSGREQVRTFFPVSLGFTFKTRVQVT